MTIDELELERVWRWTGEHLTADEKAQRLQLELVRIDTLASVTLRSPARDQRQGLVQLEIQSPPDQRIAPPSPECDTRLPTTKKKPKERR
jgi:hypothetical protein